MQNSTYEVLKYIQEEDRLRYSEIIETKQKNIKTYNEKLRILHDELRATPTNKFDPKDHLNDLKHLIDLSCGGIRYISSPLNWEESKRLSEVNLKENNNLNFFISNETVIRGKLINEVYPYKESIKLAFFSEKMIELSGDINLVIKSFFLDGFNKESFRWKPKETLFGEFWVYLLESNHRKFIVFSEERLSLEMYTLEGMLINLQDSMKLGEIKSVFKNLPIFVLNKAKQSRPIFNTHSELIEKTKELGLTHDKFFNWLFYETDKKTTFRQPDYFEYLMSAFLLQGNAEYPLNLMIIAKAGTGKSTIEDVIWQKMDEEIQIVEGSVSTLKALIPSFKNTMPDPGAMLRANRICVIDEFLRILMRCEKEERNIQLSSMNPILEHRKNRKISSGNGEIVMNPTARYLAATNPVWGTGTMVQFTDKFDNSLISRWLVWYQDSDHVKFVQENSGIEENTFMLEKDDWLGIFDYLTKFECELNTKRLRDIFDLGLNYLGEDLEENIMRDCRTVYSARYFHHILCLMDGIIKTRCICTGDDKFEANEDDYKKITSIWFRMLTGWGMILQDLDEAMLMKCNFYDKD